MSSIILCSLIFILLALGLFQLYKSTKTRENMKTKQQHRNKIGSDNQKDDSVVYNINEREIVINEVVDKKAGEPKPLTSLNCNCWPLGESEKGSDFKNKQKLNHHHHKMKPHEEEQDSSHHIPTHKGYTKQLHSRDPKTGLIQEKGPEGASPYELISGFR